MESIPVPAPDRSAFNKQRPPSDLLVSQLKYFQHLHVKHGHTIDPALAKDIATEAGAARYIAAVTRAIREGALKEGRGTTAAVPKKRMRVVPRPTATQVKGGLAIAAAAGTTAKDKPAKAKRKP